MVCLARLAMAYSTGRAREALRRLLFFASYTWLLSAGFAFSYYMINVGQSYRAETVFAGLIFVGMAAVELTFPNMIAPPESASAARKRLPALAIAAALTAAQAPTLALVDRRYAAAPLAIAFAAFFSIIAWGISSARRAASGAGRGSSERTGRRMILAYLPVVAVAGAELAWLSRPGVGEPYALLSLPLAYAVTSLQFLRQARPNGAATIAFDPAARVPSRLPEGMVRERALSQREEDVASLILQGKDNKEIAASLGLSVNTVRNHIYGLYRKLGIQRRMDLLRLLRDFGAE